LIANVPLLLWAAVRRPRIQNSFALSTLADTGRQAIGKRDNQPLMKRVFSPQSLGCWAFAFLAFGSTCGSFAATWLPLELNGVDARSFGVDPNNHFHVYLGTANGLPIGDL
jgi:hypothetical protein